MLWTNKDNNKSILARTDMFSRTPSISFQWSLISRTPSIPLILLITLEQEYTDLCIYTWCKIIPTYTVPAERLTLALSLPVASWPLPSVRGRDRDSNHERDPSLSSFTHALLFHDSMSPFNVFSVLYLLSFVLLRLCLMHNPFLSVHPA